MERGYTEEQVELWQLISRSLLDLEKLIEVKSLNVKLSNGDNSCYDKDFVSLLKIAIKNTSIEIEKRFNSAIDNDGAMPISTDVFLIFSCYLIELRTKIGNKIEDINSEVLSLCSSVKIFNIPFKKKE